jgi:hypothetical protein
MAGIKVTNKLNGGIDTDTTPEALNNTKLRDAVNVDIYDTGKYSKLTNIRGTTNIVSYLPNDTDLDTLNVLGVFNIEFLADYAGTLSYETHRALAIFTYDSTNGSQITIVDLITNEAVLMYPNVASSVSLDFPVDGTISASYTKDRGIPEILWDDNKNELRKLTLRYSTAPTFSFPTLADINVRKKVGGLEPQFVGYGTNGYTTAGTYQVCFRFYNSLKNTSTKWSLFTNPIPISNSDGCTLSYPLGDGGNIGQSITKTIKLSIDFTDTPSALYDSIQLAVVKNIDGLTIPSNTVYITLPSKDWYDNPTDIEYSDAVSFEAPYPLENIILDDAAIKCAKTQLIKDNVLVRGNIEYNNFENDRGTVDFDDAYTIKDNVCYNDGSDVVEKKGYFREEVYAYAVAYYDEFFNFGLVQPLDFTKVYKMTTKRTLTVSSIGTPDTYNQLTIVVSSTSGLACGDYLRYLNKAYQVCEVNNATTMLIKYRPDLTTTSSGGDLEVLYGQEGNQMQGWTWKFPARSDNKFAIFSGEFPLPQALGLHIKGLKNHPTWAKGFVIVRQDRIKNILFQSPHIPAMAVQGVATQGIGPITYNESEPDNINKFDTSLADYKGELDFIAPKIMGLGHAMNVVKAYLQFEFAGQRFYITQYPIYTRQKKTYSNDNGIASLWYQPAAQNPFLESPFREVIDPLYGAETPKAMYVVPPDYIMNNAGQPTFNYVLNGNEKVEIVDAIALERQELNDESPNIDISNLYLAVPTQGYYYSKQGYILQNTTDKVYFVKLSELDTDISGVTVNKGYDIVLGQAPLTLDNYIFDSDTYKNINIINGTEQLSVQQGTPRPVPSATNSFINVCATQRGKLLLTNNAILDFTKVIYDEISGTGNLFPNISDAEYDTKMYNVDHLKDKIGLYDEFIYIDEAPVKNIFTDANKINSGSYILNITKGLPDNRYSQISNNWRFTGAVHILTESEVANNTPIDIDVWGGDCFLTNYQIKINNNTPRISDIFETISDEAKDYIVANNDSYYFFNKSVKTGSFKNNVELMMLIIESEVNTGYVKDTEKVFTSTGKPTTYFAKPFLYQYNGSYSINNVLKSFVTKAPDIFKGTRFESRFVWSKTRLYQAEGSAFVDTEGFDFFPVDNKRDLDEQYGGITSLVDFGDYKLYLIQENKVRVEPINRTVTNTADNSEVVMLSTNFVGSSGQYMPFANGSQHIRTVQSFNGTCFFMDAQRRMLCTFGSGGYSVLSQNDINKYFNETFASPDAIKEKDLIGIINSVQEKQQYWLIKTEDNRLSQKAIIYDVRGKNFNTRIDTGADLILNGVSNGEFMFLNHGKSLFTAYTNSQFGYLLDKYRDSKFTIIINDYPSYTKTFNVMNFEMKGGFILNKDSIIGTTPNNFAGVQQTPNMLVWNSASGQIPPFQSRNFQYWLNRIRQNTTPKYKMRGDYMVVDFIVVNDSTDNREVSIASIITACEINARVR